jgi:hypothetical protein
MIPKEQFARILATREVVIWPKSVTIVSNNKLNIDEMALWLRKNIGKDGEDWTISSYHFFKGHKITVKFKNSNDKTLFALTWTQ